MDKLSGDAMTPSSGLDVTQYNRLYRPFRRILLVSVYWLAPVIWIAVNTVINTNELTTQQWVDRLIFLVYLCFFAATWTVYFRSKKDIRRFDENGQPVGIQSLRRLLGEVSEQWNPDPKHKNEEQVKAAFRNKASSSMQVLAILTAVAVLILDIAGNVWVSKAQIMEPWDAYSISFASLMALIAFVSFLVSIDALDTLFNRIENTVNKNVILRHFYQLTINPKYYGMVSMVLAVVFLLQVFSTVLASVAIAFILLIGYSLWFPQLSSTLKYFHICEEDEICELSRRQHYRLNGMRILFVLAPVIAHQALA